MSLRTVVFSIVLPAGIFACSAAGSSEVTGRTSAALSVSGQIKSQDGLCLDVLDNRQISGAAVDSATCNGTTAQTFTWNASTPGPIINTASGLCLDDVWGGGAALEMVTCTGTPEQTWTIQGSTQNAAIVDGYYHCVDILGNQQVNGQTVDPATCNGSGAQVWQFVPPCGGQGQAACSGNSCNSNLTAVGSPAICCPNGEVDFNGSCSKCGGLGEPGCGSAPNLFCSPGYFVPFNPSTHQAGVCTGCDSATIHATVTPTTEGAVSFHVTTSPAFGVTLTMSLQQNGRVEASWEGLDYNFTTSGGASVPFSGLSDTAFYEAAYQVSGCNVVRFATNVVTGGPYGSSGNGGTPPPYCDPPIQCWEDCGNGGVSIGQYCDLEDAQAAYNNGCDVYCQ